MNRHFRIVQYVDEKRNKTICERGLIGLSKNGEFYILSEDGQRAIATYRNARVVEIAAHVIEIEAFEQAATKSSVTFKHRRFYCTYTP